MLIPRLMTGVSWAVCLVSAAGQATEPPITAVAFTPDGKSVLVCSQAGVHVFGWPELQRQRKLEVEAANLHTLAFSPSGDRLAVAGGTPAEQGSVEILSWPAGKPLEAFTEYDDLVMALAWRDPTTLAAASLDHTVTLYDTRAGKPTQTLRGHSRGVTALCWLPDRQTLVSAGIDQSLRVWKPDDGQLLRSLSLHTLPVSTVCLRPGDQALPMVASASTDKTVRLWQPTIGRMVRFARLPAKPLEIAWLADGSGILAACTDGHVRVIDPDTVELLQDIPVLTGWAYALAAHPSDGSIVVGGSDGELRRVRPEITSP